tara:strand:+ start:3601 stop:4131 length:531 start_codon:yes stop_codon:yes gene_type:complete
MDANSPNGQALQGIRDEIVTLLPRLRRFSRSLTRDAADGDDLLQLTVERALVKLEQWTPGTRLDSWMYRIMKNIWIDEIRARSRRSAVFATEEAGERVGAEDPDFERRLRAMSVEQAMETLPDEQRLAIGLVLVEGLSYSEAAAVMDVPVGTLTSRLARGRAALEARLSPQEGNAS